MELFGTQIIDEKGLFTIGGVDVATLSATYGTPLYVMDEAHVRAQCRWFKQAFRHKGLVTEVIYASKAFLTKGFCRWIQQEGLSLDVVSGGELATAIKAGFPQKQIYFHGNNKSRDELTMAVRYGVGTIVIDHEHEIDVLESVLKESDRVTVMLRINPGIEAHTHEYIATTKNDSKFGLSIFDPHTMDVIERLANHPRLSFCGFHSHIGSQIFEASSFFKHAKTVLNYISKVKDKTGVIIDVMNLGGGFGVKYTEEDTPILDEAFLPELAAYVSKTASQLGIKKPKTCIEPGRAIVANAGITLYEVATTKQTYGGKNYVFVDGSMADHIRTVLYNARYQSVLANRMNETHEHPFTVTGKACESGDIIIRNAYLPQPKSGDLLAVLSTGAYHYSMASNYNRLPRPAVVAVNEGISRLLIRRETYEDLMQYDVEDDTR